ncbi:MAG: BatA domain-containing protein, partial [Patescibacteria group bacterium]|nr:BatA domain-containing protein [Patescibacteria group bacterium]
MPWRCRVTWHREGAPERLPMHALRLIVVAFGFLNLPLLGWLAAAAVPIAIHLWARRRYREVSFAAMDYLLAAMKRQSHRLRMEEWLLLALRTLLVVLVVLAVAEPYLERPLLLRAAGGRTHRVLVLDGSFSMAYQPTDQSRFARAKEMAREIVENAPAGDAFTLLLMSAPPQVVVGVPAPASDEMLAEIDRLIQPHTTSNIATVISHVQSMIETARRENPRLARHEVFFLTDLQRAAWSPQGAPTQGTPGQGTPSQGSTPRGAQGALAEFHAQVADLAEAAAIAVMDVGQPAADNLAVSTLSLLAAPAIAGRSCRFEATVKSFSAQPATRQSVELYVDGRRVAQRTVDVPPGGEAKVLFDHRFDLAGDHAVEVRAEGDLLTLD